MLYTIPWPVLLVGGPFDGRIVEYNGGTHIEGYDGTRVARYQFMGVDINEATFVGYEESHDSQR